MDIQTTTYERDDMGGQTLTYTVYEANVPCWVQPVYGNETNEYDQRGFKVSHKVYFNHDPDFTENRQRMIWVDENDVRHVLEFVFERDASSGLGSLHRVDCEEVSNRPEEDQ